MPIPSQVAVLRNTLIPSEVVSSTSSSPLKVTFRNPSNFNNGIEVYRVEDLPCGASSAIDAIGYKISEQEFYIQWVKSGNTTKYFNVPPEIWEQFLTAKSVGSLYHRVIKGKFCGPTNSFNLVD